MGRTPKEIKDAKRRKAEASREEWLARWRPEPFLYNLEAEAAKMEARITGLAVGGEMRAGFHEVLRTGVDSFLIQYSRVHHKAGQVEEITLEQLRRVAVPVRAERVNERSWHVWSAEQLERQGLN